MGTGAIANAFAEALKESERGELVAVGSRRRKHAEQFAATFGVPAAHVTYESLLSDPEVDIVYIALPHVFHSEWAIRAAEAGKHILCEKPIGINRAEASAMIAAAKENDVFLMEAFMYRCHPQTTRLVEMIRSGVIGEVRMIRATFSFMTRFKKESRLLDPALGGGGILDVGCYPVSMVRLIAGVATGKPFADPIEVAGAGVIGSESGVDEYAIATLKFEGSILATVTCGLSLEMENTVLIAGSLGSIVVPSPWFGSRSAGFSKLVVFKGGIPDEIVVETGKSLYANEADYVAEHLLERQAPAMAWGDTLGNMATLDRWRAAVGMEYPSEKLGQMMGPAGHRSLRRMERVPVAAGVIHGVGQPVSELILTPGMARTLPDEFALMDAYFERGGNAFCLPARGDMSHVSELIGRWVASRGLRSEVSLIARSNRIPQPTPAHFRAGLSKRLREMGTEAVELFIADGDNPAIPVEEFVGALAEEVKAGRCAAYGLGRWQPERVRAGVGFAQASGLPRPSAILSAFSLALGEESNCPECVQWATRGNVEWLKATQMAVIACGCRAQAFFAGASDPKCDDWLATTRRELAQEMAREHGTDTLSIALAWVFHQTFPTFALVEVVTPEDLDQLFRASGLRLTSVEVARLLAPDAV
jgi:predicted dehydrogenase/aryl-alcohol dehydrogenase-like predicted oxidoreductase